MARFADVAPEMAPVLRSLGAVEVAVDVVQPVLRREEDLRVHARTMEAIADPVVAQGLASTEEVAALVDDLDRWAAEPNVVATLPRILQVAARVPA